MKLTQAGAVAALGAALALILTAPGRAIPAFARKYHTTCARCHSVVPRLNNYGWNFKMRGYHVPGDEEIGKVPMPEDPFLHLLDQVPLAVRLQGNVQSSTAKGARPTSTLDSEIDLLMAGTLARRLGFWAEIDTAKNPDGSFSTEIGNVHGIFRDLLPHMPIALNLEVGKFNIDEFGISTGRILTQNPYAIYDVGDALANFPESDEVQGLNFFGAIGTGIGKGVGPTKQKEAKPGEVTEEEKKALEEALKQEKPTQPPPETPEMVAARAVLDVLVKKGTLTQEEADKTLADLASKLPAPPPPAPTEAAAPPAAVSLSKSDYDVRKGLFYQAGLVTRGADGGTQPQGYARLIYSNPHNWWVGPVAYFGSNSFAATANAPSFVNHFNRYGVEAGFTTGPHRDVAGVSRRAVEVLAAYQHGRDSDVDGMGTHVNHEGGFIEAIYLLDGRNLAVLRCVVVILPFASHMLRLRFGQTI